MSRYEARRPIELGLLQREATIPQTHLPGAEPEVDLGEFYSTIAPSRASLSRTSVGRAGFAGHHLGQPGRPMVGLASISPGDLALTAV